MNQREQDTKQNFPNSNLNSISTVPLAQLQKCGESLPLGSQAFKIIFQEAHSKGWNNLEGRQYFR